MLARCVGAAGLRAGVHNVTARFGHTASHQKICHKTTLSGLTAAAAAAAFASYSFAQRQADCSVDTIVDESVTWETLSYATAVHTIRAAFACPAATLMDLKAHFTSEMDKGLKGEPSSIMMLPAFISHRITGEEKGNFYALDLGGTNFRVLKVPLLGAGQVGELTAMKFAIPDNIMSNSTAEDLFGFLADCVAEFIAKESGGDSKGSLGFTFSFPVQQTALNAGTLLMWTKGFHVDGVEGQDVVALLQTAFTARGIEMEIHALVNDTVGTMEAHAYSDPNTTMGVILGTGTNAAYIEKQSNIPKWKGKEEMGLVAEESQLKQLKAIFDLVDENGDGIVQRSEFSKMCKSEAINISNFLLGTHKNNTKDQINAVFRSLDTNKDQEISWEEFKNHFKAPPEMVINTEWGGTDTSQFQNQFDRALDAASMRPGKTLFEKQISGMFLGELTRYTILSSKVCAGFSEKAAAGLHTAFSQPGSFQTQYMSVIEADTTPTLSGVEQLLGAQGVANTTLADRALVREAVKAVASRAARMSATGVAALVDKTKPEGLCTVAIDGTLFKVYPGFKARMEGALVDLYGKERASEIALVLSEDGSGIGAAIIAAIETYKGVAV